jgi:hypothetical protein
MDFQIRKLKISQLKKNLVWKIFKKNNLEVFNFQIFRKLEPKVMLKIK